MIDLIFLTFFLGLFIAGFWCGKTYGTAAAMIDGAKKAVASLFGSHVK
jgi:spore maturation protein SpmA